MSYENAYDIGYTARAKQKDYDPLSNSAICEYIDNAIALDLDLAESKARVIELEQSCDGHKILGLEEDVKLRDNRIAELEGLLKDAIEILDTPPLDSDWRSFASDFVLQNK